MTDKRDRRCMKLLNLTYEQLQAEKLRIRLEAVREHLVIFLASTVRK